MIYFFVDAENLHDELQKSNLNPASFQLVNSNALTGDLVTGAALVAISGTAIKHLAMIISTYLSRNQTINVKFNGNNIEFESENIDHESIISILKEVSQLKNE